MSMDEGDAPDDGDGDGPEAERGFIRDGDFRSGFGQELSAVLDMVSWEAGHDFKRLFAEFKTQVSQSVNKEESLRSIIRKQLFHQIKSAKLAPDGAGVFPADLSWLDTIREQLLYQGLVEAVNSTVVSHDSLPISVTQIGVAIVSYNATTGVFSQRLFRKEMAAQVDGLAEAIAFIQKRQARSGAGRRDELSTLARRGIRTYAERAILLERATAEWRMGYGNPFAPELLSGSGYTSLLTVSLGLLRNLLEKHPKFVFVSDSLHDIGLLTLGNALNVGEYLILDTVEADSLRIVDRWDYENRGQNEARQFVRECGPLVLRGLFRASDNAPPYLFYAHREHVHLAAHVALADSILRSERGFPMLLDVAEVACRGAFGAEGFMGLMHDAYTHAGAKFHYLRAHKRRR
ncbi:hypothetical protein D187_006819 [Cystobacter fuscus DSM 2262]|uniref:Uncharacterized protein n=1 Tax=Cystobacter fuscus (strain ATCC 25194 / DSM 2262 / NBRC 100088 / M29) TaxID=1242864 RepID=S9NXZ1_CYSF2|nr:hypothetical protein [Cystobacter fuscus]EPX57065.1 hypothetical protein D187_006819 [Cystobacter fuscus DSM 2262]